MQCILHDIRHRHRHRGGVLNKTLPPTELQISATITTLFKRHWVTQAARHETSQDMRSRQDCSAADRERLDAFLRRCKRLRYCDDNLPSIVNLFHDADNQLLWPPYVIGGPLYFCPVVSFLLSSFYLFFSSPNLNGSRSDVCHTSTHGVALVRI